VCGGEDSFSTGLSLAFEDCFSYMKYLEACGAVQHISGSRGRLYLFFANTLTVLESPRRFFP